MRERWRHQEHAPVKIDHPRDAVLASDLEELGVSLPADITQHDALVAFNFNGSGGWV